MLHPSSCFETCYGFFYNFVVYVIVFYIKPQLIVIFLGAGTDYNLTGSVTQRLYSIISYHYTV